jgi:hypothetical protein
MRPMCCVLLIASGCSTKPTSSKQHDMALANMDMGDAGMSTCTTNCMDMAGHPDLMPMCTVATVATAASA